MIVPASMSYPVHGHILRRRSLCCEYAVAGRRPHSPAAGYGPLGSPGAGAGQPLSGAVAAASSHPSSSQTSSLSDRNPTIPQLLPCPAPSHDQPSRPTTSNGYRANGLQVPDQGPPQGPTSLSCIDTRACRRERFASCPSLRPSPPSEAASDSTHTAYTERRHRPAYLA